MRKSFLTILCSLCSALVLLAEEGMWIPSLLKSLQPSMQKLGCKLTAEDIYNINKSSLKDAIVHFGGGCTGSMISEEGLLITNHHCGYGQIQSHSSVENDYLTNGFWAYNKKEELPCKGLTVTFIIRIEDVTSRILEGVSDDMSEAQRDSVIQARSKKIEKEATDGTHYTARVRSFYYGNEFYLFVMEVFKDVRMVGVPPESIGKFGGDTDNWIWPRHTGDFALFRVYADKNNKPAEYAPDNVPFKPRYFLPISLKGVQENDFAMVFGFPGRTTEYLPSMGVELIQKVSNPISVKARKERLAIWETDMKKDAKVRIQYASKYAGVSNYYKKWTGEIRGLKRANGIILKQNIEKSFQERVSQNPEWNKKYGSLLADFKTAYTKFTPYQKIVDYFTETIFAVEIIRYASRFVAAVNATSKEDRKEKLENLKKGIDGFYKNFNPPTDKKLFAAMLRMYYENVDKNMHPEFYKIVEKKYKGNFEKYAEDVYKKSIFTYHTKIRDALNSFEWEPKKIQSDPAYMIAKTAYYDFFEKRIEPEYNDIENEITRLQRKYIKALMEVMPEKKYYPDANGTMRVSFGKIEGYEGNDGIILKYYTTLDGVMEKEDSTNSEFIVPKKLKELYQKKDYGQYADKNGKIIVAIVSSQHTTGGNSGSPLIDAHGNLIGVNFDRNWEGTANDIIYDDNQGRSIIVDIRYVLFVIDKFAGATNLINEMKIVSQ